MKKNLILLAALIFGNFIHSQVVVDLRELEPYQDRRYNNNSSEYYKDLNGHLDKFVGAWRFEENGHLVELEVVKYTRENTDVLRPFRPPTYWSDGLGLRFKYTFNGVVLVDCLTGAQGDDSHIYVGHFINEISAIGVNSPIDQLNSKLLAIYSEPQPNGICRSTEAAELELGYQTATNMVNGIQTTGILHWRRFAAPLYATPGGLVGGVYCDDSPYQLPTDMIFIKQP